ncbi:hypothetical protein [Krasilnikovia sp. MM14-A1004]|uniref:hypothetical protein n=1 Tax=Krasilnikovia sp. MM14-A1004 TaxID=3373541 RepID=UPI00399D2063
MTPPPAPDRTQVTASQQQLQQSTDQVKQAHAKVSDELIRLIDTVNGTLSRMDDWSWIGGLGGMFVSDMYGDKVRDAMQRLRTEVEKVLAVVKKVLDEAVPVISLITRAFDWLEKVQAPVAGMSDTAAQYIVNLNNWSGPAKQAYDQRVPIQVKAVDGLAGAAADTATWLSDLAAANALYILSMFKPLFDIGGALAAAVVDAATIAGALEAIGKGGELVQIAVSAMYEALEKALEHVTTVINKMVDAKKVMGELGDSWPQMVTR